MRKLRYLLAAVVVLFVATTAIALAGQRSPAHTREHARAHSVKLAAHTSRHARQTPAQAEQAAADTDNVQQGDQTTPDTPSSGASEETAAQGEQSTDTEQGGSGEPSGGHQDPPGDVNHECSGNCQE